MAASTNLTPEQRSQRATLAAYAKHAKRSTKDRTASIGEAQSLEEFALSLDEFRQEIIAEQGEIPEPELTRRANCRRLERIAREAFEASKQDTR